MPRAKSSDLSSGSPVCSRCDRDAVWCDAGLCRSTLLRCLLMLLTTTSQGDAGVALYVGAYLYTFTFVFKTDLDTVNNCYMNSVLSYRIILLGILASDG